MQSNCGKWAFIHSFIHLFCKKTVDRTQLYNKTRELVKVQQFKHVRVITDKITSTDRINSVNVNDLLRMLTGKRAIVYRLG